MCPATPDQADARCGRVLSPCGALPVARICLPMTDSQDRSRRRWITLGELIALAALIISALGLWLTWKSGEKDGPTRIVEQRQAIPLKLRGKVTDEGRRLVIAPIESSHALETMTITISGSSPIQVGNDGSLYARDVEGALKDKTKDKKGSLVAPARIDARYVESGADRRGGGNYVLHYHWEGGGLFSGRSLRLESLSRG